MLAGIGRVIGGLFVAVGMLLLWAVLLPAVIMLVALYLARLLPLTGQWRARFRNRVKTSGSIAVASSQTAAPGNAPKARVRTTDSS
jgi:uncharacterized membrane protein YphA (DoxX/SURF4 family)